MDIPISKLGNNLNFTFSDRFRSESTTFRDLLSHRSCLNKAGNILFFDVAPIEEWVYRTRYDNESCSHRAGFVYNNALYALAGTLIAEIAGKPHRALMAELLTALNMTSSKVADPEGSYENLPDMSHAYTRHEGQVFEFDRKHLRRLGVAGGAGDILSTATDMAKYIQVHLNGGSVSGQQIIPKEVLDWMYVASTPLPAFNFAASTGSYAYSLGLLMAQFEGQPWITHGGYWPPYESSFSLFPSFKNTTIGIFSSINGPGTTGSVPDTLAQEYLHILIMRVLQGDSESLDKLKESRVNSKISPKYSLINNLDIPPMLINSVDPAPAPQLLQSKIPHETVKFQVEELVGIYGSPQDGVLNINLNSDNADNLNINYGEWGIGVLTPDSSQINVFNVEWTTTLNYDFYSYGPTYPVPVFSVDFGKLDQLTLLTNGAAGDNFFRNLTLDTLPVIPWNPDSCGPTNINRD